MHPQQEEEHIVSEIYDGYQDTQREILAIELNKTRTKLFTIAAIVFIFDLLTLLAVNLLTARTVLIISAVPVVMVLLAFLSMKEPILAMIVASIIIVGIWIYIISKTGGQGAISGWLAKAILVYLMIAGFQHASEAQRIKKELQA